MNLTWPSRTLKEERGARTRADARPGAIIFQNKALALPLLLLIGFAARAEPQAPQAYQISVNVDLVVLNATVPDPRGLVASDLREQDFEVYEDGVRQSLRFFRHEDIPVTVGLVVDHSGSMRPKLRDVIAAARTFVQSSSPEDEMFVVNFNENVTLGLPDAIRLSNRPDELARAIANTPATGRTALGKRGSPSFLKQGDEDGLLARGARCRDLGLSFVGAFSRGGRAGRL